MLFHQLAGNFFFQSKIIAELGTAGVALLNSGSNPCPPDRLSVEDLVHFAQHWEYSPQMAWSKLLLTYLPPLYNAFDKQNAMYSICLTDFPLPRRRYSIKRVPRPANPLHTCSAFSEWCCQTQLQNLNQAASTQIFQDFNCIQWGWSSISIDVYSVESCLRL